MHGETVKFTVHKILKLAMKYNLQSLERVAHKSSMPNLEVRQVSVAYVFLLSYERVFG